MDALDAEEADLLRAAVPAMPEGEWERVRGSPDAPAAQNVQARVVLDHVLIAGRVARPVLRPEFAGVLVGPGAS